jgi:hypothetical protein
LKITLFIKISVLCIVFLFIGVTINPVFAINKENNYVEVEVDFCGLNNKHIASLTQQELIEVNEIFKNLRHQLSTVDNRDDAKIIFNVTVEKLNEYGLLGEISVEKAKKLVNGDFLKINDNLNENHIQKIKQKIGDNANLFCSIAGQTKGTFFCGPIGTFFNKIGSFVFYFMAYLGMLLMISMLSTFFNTMYNPLMIFSMVAYGAFGGFGGDPIPAEGWVSSVGLLGNKSWETPLYGWLFRFPIFLYFIMAYPGISGFTGIKLLTNNETHEYYYLGFALLARLGSKPLYNIW